MQEAPNDNASVNEDPFKVPEASSWKPWLIASGAALAILAIPLGLMWSLGLFEIPKDDTGTKTLATALGLIGSVLSAVITLVGTVVKYSIDDRNAQLAAAEKARTHALAVEAEKRNRIEAAIRAVDLLSENNKDTTENQIGGAVLALVSLGELDLAVALLAQLWPKGLTSALVAEVVLRQALKTVKTGSADTQISAAAVLLQNANQIQQDVYSEISQLADVHIRIPMLGVKQSLNVAVAGGVVLYEPEFPIWNSDSNMVLALFS